MGEITIVENLNDMTVSIKYQDIDICMPLVDFSRLSLKHMQTGALMSDLIREYQENLK